MIIHYGAFGRTSRPDKQALFPSPPCLGLPLATRSREKRQLPSALGVKDRTISSLQKWTASQDAWLAF
jgi:hypothetical protein